LIEVKFGQKNGASNKSGSAIFKKLFWVGF
jgi:hypothetical protein